MILIKFFFSVTLNDKTKNNFISLLFFEVLLFQLYIEHHKFIAYCYK